MDRPVLRWTTTTLAAIGLTVSIGCDNNSTTATAPNSGAGITGATPGQQVTGPKVGPSSPGGAPSFGEPTGTGFPTGDAANAGGQGSGLLGYHGTGSMGTSAAISDMHDPGHPPKGGGQQWVLPEQ